jgi:trk system potassium uptake protein
MVMSFNFERQSRFLERLFRSPNAMLVAGFAAVILLGTFLLWTPWAGKANFVDALFISTSAMCVTGLAPVDVASVFTPFGHGVIVLLIQIGGLGVMTYAAVILQLLGRRLSLRSLALVQDTIYQQNAAAQFRDSFRRILLLTLVIELAGVMVLFLSLLPTNSLGHSLWSAVFHSVSAFCNAGFSIYSNNLVDLRGNWMFTGTIMALIVAGGLGFTVLYQIWNAVKVWTGRKNREKPHLFSLHARVVLRVTAALIVVGTLGLLLFGLTGEEKSVSDQWWGALFQSITARTAGFNTVHIGALPLTSLLFLIGLMFIGGSPASTAGGIKTTGLAIWLARIRAGLRKDRDTTILGHRLSDDLVRRTYTLISLAVIGNVIGVFILLLTESSTAGVGLHDVLFEQISAFGTVGLSAGLTPKLTVIGKLWISATMFWGRLGPLAIASLAFSENRLRVRYPEGRLMIG